MKLFRHYLLFIYVFSTTAMAQTWSIEARPTLNFPTAKVFDQKLRLGNGFELTGVHRFQPRIDLYASLTWKRYDTDEDYDEVDVELIQKGVALGAQWYWKNPNDLKAALFLRSGITIASVRSRSEDPMMQVDSRVGVGIEVGFGIKFKSAGNWHFLPELGYSNASYPYGGNDQKITLHSILFSVAARRDF